MKKSISVLFYILHSTFYIPSSSAQELKYYRYDTDLLSKDFHQGRRAAFRDMMPDNSVAVIFANPERTRFNDVDYFYHQNPNLYYLTGFTEPNCMLIMFKKPFSWNGTVADEYLFVQDRDPAEESWKGRRAGREGAMELTGIKAVFLNSAFDSMDVDFKKFDKLLTYVPKELEERASNKEGLAHLVEVFKQKSSFPSDNWDRRVMTSLLELRGIKSPEELTLLRKAIAISCQGHVEIMKALKPGMHEYDAQAIGEYVFKRNGSEYEGYPSICGGGENSCILHYETNRRPLRAGDLQLDDMGAEYHGYSADVTRTIPVGGKFSKEQKLIYELVLKAQEAGFNACKPGNEFRDPHRAAADVIKKGLVELGIIKEESDYKKYFMHGTSHYLGLDVHDGGKSNAKLEAGMVLTVEPGIYIPEGSPCDPKWWNIGVRIEDDVLITKTDHENLSASAPRTVEAIEATMKQEPEWVKQNVKGH